MKAKNKKTNRFSESLTAKGLIIAVLIVLLLIPGTMIQSLIEERQERSREAIERINEKWSNAQTLCAPVLSIPFTIKQPDGDGNLVTKDHVLNITPELLNIDTKLLPEKRHYGIYKTILYKSEINISGQFEKIDIDQMASGVIHWDKAFIRIGLTDLRGVTNNSLTLNGKSYTTEAGGSTNKLIGKELIAKLDGRIFEENNKPYTFEYKMSLNGSGSINYIPIGKTTTVHVSGDWSDPGFVGNFSPEHTPVEKGFDATWSVLRFNRNIPETWVDNKVEGFADSSFGVNLVNMVDHYQQNMRSAKYAIMFIALTFAVFFLVEVTTKKRIHPIEYLLVGLALIIFYSLLLSISEQSNFGMAYLIASAATIGLIVAYAQSIFRSWKQTGIMLFTLCLLYTFLYVILQLEDIALLIGSVGLFIILGVIMFCTRKINWYKPEEENDLEEEKDDEPGVVPPPVPMDY